MSDGLNHAMSALWGELVNPSKESKVCRRIVFTCNNPKLSGEEFKEKFVTEFNPRFLVFQLERGEENTPHFQGYAEFDKPRSYGPISKKMDCWCHQAEKPAEANIKYCTKEGRDDGPWTHGDSTGQGKRNDLLEAKAAFQSGGLKAVYDDHFEVFAKYHRAFMIGEQYDEPKRGDVEVILLYGPPGGGKTYHAENSDDMVWTTGSGWSSSAYWFDGLSRATRTVCIDEFVGQVKLADFLKLLNKRAQLVPIKGGFTWMAATTIYITTNIHPFYWFDWNGRSAQWPALVRRINRVDGFRNFQRYPLDKEAFFAWRRLNILETEDDYEMIPQ